MAADVRIGPEYYDVIRERLKAAPLSSHEKSLARSALLEILRWSQGGAAPCEKNGNELANLLGYKEDTLIKALRLLEGVGAIYRVRRANTKTITPNAKLLSSEDIARLCAEAEAAAQNPDLSIPVERLRMRKRRWRDQHKEDVNEARRLARAARDAPSDPPAASQALPTGRAAAA